MEEETWETGTWEPYAEGRWIAIIQRIRDNRTGEIRESRTQSFMDDGDVNPSTWNWTEGNHACNCNRSIQFYSAKGITLGDDEEDECGVGNYSIQLVNPVNGRVFYDEFGQINVTLN